VIQGVANAIVQHCLVVLPAVRARNAAIELEAHATHACAPCPPGYTTLKCKGSAAMHMHSCMRSSLSFSVQLAGAMASRGAGVACVLPCTHSCLPQSFVSLCFLQSVPL
jgi:hypothetical protein